MKFITIKKSILFLILSIFTFVIISLFIIINYNSKISDYTIDTSPKVNDENINNITNSLEQINNFYLEQYNKKKLVALTFDDGPSEYTSILVDELKKRNVNVTFFILGKSAEKYNDILKFQFDTGNEINIHSYEHKLFTKLKKEEIIEQIDKTNKIIYNITGTTPKYMRVPYGSRNEKVDEILKEKKLTDVLWTVDSKDWKFQNVSKTYNYILKNFKGNEIILMHDTFDTSIKTAIKLVDKLLEKGYTFVTIDTFLNIAKQTEGNISSNNILKQKIF